MFTVVSVCLHENSLVLIFTLMCRLFYTNSGKIFPVIFCEDLYPEMNRAHFTSRQNWKIIQNLLLNCVSNKLQCLRNLKNVCSFGITPQLDFRKFFWQKLKSTKRVSWWFYHRHPFSCDHSFIKCSCQSGEAWLLPVLKNCHGWLG